MIFNRVNISALDRIVLTSEDVIKINEKLDELMANPSIVKSVMEADIPFDTKGIVSYELMGLKKLLGKDASITQFYFNLANPKGIEITEIDNEGNMLYRVILDTSGEKYETQVFKKREGFSESNILDMSKQIALMLLDFMKYTQYIGYLKQNNPVIIRRSTVKQSSQTSIDKPTKSGRAVVSVSKPKRIYDYEQAEREGEKRPYERKAESWEVAGHWREYKKTGKRVFIKGHRRGEGVKKGKDYTV